MNWKTELMQYVKELKLLNKTLQKEYIHDLIEESKYIKTFEQFQDWENRAGKVFNLHFDEVLNAMIEASKY